MRRLPSDDFGSWILLIASLSIAARCGAQAPRANLEPNDVVAPAQVVAAYGRVPLSFEANLGQVKGRGSERVQFLSRGRGYTLFLSGDEAVLKLQRSSQESGVRSQKSGSRSSVLSSQPEGLGESRISARRAARFHGGPNPESRVPAVVRLKFEHANPQARVIGEDELPGKANYFIGQDPQKWRTNVSTYGRVKAQEIYPGIDVVYYGRAGELEYDLVVAPGADPKRIALKIETGNSKLETRNSKLETRNSKLENGKAAANPESRTPDPDSVRIAANGDLVIETGGGEVRLKKPVVYQETGTWDSGLGTGESPNLSSAESQTPSPRKRFLDARYVLRPIQNPKSQIPNGYEVSFEIASYDRTRPLIIDPVLTYSTYLGGTGFDYAYGIAVDASGNAYVTGQTDSLDFPVPKALQKSPGGGTCGSDLDVFPCFDAFVTKLAPSGSAVVYSTYLGGSNDDFGRGLAVDSAGNAYVTGYTTSLDFPVNHAIQPAYAGGNCGSATNPIACFDSFVAKLNAAGSALVYATYLGGVGDDLAAGIAVDSSGNASIAGSTSSADFPTTAGAVQTAYAGGNLDAFVTKLSPAGSAAVYSTYLGGSDEDRGLAVAQNSSGDAFVTGSTASTNFPHAGGFQSANAGGTCGSIISPAPCTDAFVARLNPLGTILGYSSYLGGTGGESANAIAVDASGAAYLAGMTTSSNFPTTPGALERTGGGTSVDAFVTKFNASGSTLAYSTYLGGIGQETAYGIAVNSAGNAFVTGEVNDSAFPLASPVQKSSGGFIDAFLTKLNAAGSAVIFSSFLGGSGNETGRAIALDNSGNATIAGGTFSVDFPAASAFQATYGGGSFDAFVARVSSLALPVLTLSEISIVFDGQGVGTSSSPHTVTLTNNGDAALAISSIAVTGDFAQTNNCGASLAAGSSCALHITSSPSELGPRTGTVTITDNAWGSPHAISLAGNGIPSPVVKLSPTSLSFSSQWVGKSSAPKSVSLSNTGSVTLGISGISTLGDFGETNNCGSSVLAGGSCTIQVTFSPTAAGGMGGQLTLTDNAPGSPHVVTLTGTGTGPAISLSPTSLSFGNQRVGTTSNSRKLTLSSSGVVALKISGITASGDFSQTNNCPGSLLPGSSCTINVKFAPTQTGPRPGAITIADNAAGSPQSVPVTGTGTEPRVKLSTSSVSFADQGVATTSDPKTLMLTNSGTSPLTLSGISVNGDFALSNGCETNVDAGASCEVQVTFAPILMGERTGILTIESDTPDSPQTVALAGIGVLAFSLSSATPETKIISGTDAVTFDVGASSPFAFAGSIRLSCDGGAPGECIFNPPSISPGEKSSLTVANLAGTSAGSVGFAVEGTAENQKAMLPLRVSIADFSLVSKSPTLAVVGGQSASFELTVGSIGGFDQPVSLACTGAPALATCSIAPASVAPGVAATVTVTTTAPSAGFQPGGGKWDFPAKQRPEMEIRWLMTILGILGLSTARKCFGRRPTPEAALVLIVLLWAGCGGGGGQSVVTKRPGTPPGTYDLKISGTFQTLARSVTVRLRVN